ncbi:MAG: cob(I)yrinic acid a,c-diamide adenosyltransferase [Ignavibacteria bacterium]|jgi:cob(I)alamin adenosyltransferase|nr:cob(I)yrinic acid a,c-diamide adenosyltransferase [Ignavibacteria bacterium]
MATRIYTKTGDDGTTGLFGGVRVPKEHIRIEAYGTVDELNAVIGVALSCETTFALHDELQHISRLMFVVGSDLATPRNPTPAYNIPRITSEHITQLERLIDAHEDTLPALKNFILPGGISAAAHLHHARTICRRAERIVSALVKEEDIGPDVLPFLNRLSDYLFVAARRANHDAHINDVLWHSEL